MKRWISVDPGTTAGVAVWAGAELVTTGVVRPIGKKGRWHVLGAETLGQVAAWRQVLHGAAVVVCEGCGFGLPRSSLAALSRTIGGLERLAELEGVRWAETNVSEWRRVAAESWPPLNWPAPRKGQKGKGQNPAKALAQSLVLEHFERQVSEDEADAVLVGHAALRMRLVDVTQEAA